MAIDDIINETTNYQAQQQQQQQQQQNQQTAGTSMQLGPVVSMEKTDLMFWMLVIQTVLLAIIAARV